MSGPERTPNIGDLEYPICNARNAAELVHVVLEGMFLREPRGSEGYSLNATDETVDAVIYGMLALKERIEEIHDKWSVVNSIAFEERHRKTAAQCQEAWS